MHVHDPATSDDVWRPRLTVAAVIEQQGRYLLVEEKVAGEIVWNQPAGHVEDRESLLDAVRREVLEETRREFEPTGLIGIYRWRIPDTGDTYFRVCFCGDAGAEDQTLKRDPDILAARWLDLATLQQASAPMRSPLVLRAISDAADGNRYPLELLHDVES